MNFDLNDDQRLLRDTLLRYFANEFPLSKVREVFESKDGMSDELWSVLAEFGMLGAIVPERYGGTELEMIDLAIVNEVLGYAAAPGPFLEHVLAALAITLGGSEQQKDRWLPQLVDGSVRATIAVNETSARWQPDEWSLVGNGGLTGDKRLVLNPEGVGLIVVGIDGGGLTLVDGDAPGLSAEMASGIDRTRRLGTLRFEETPHDPLPDGVAVSGRVRDAALVLLAADAWGAGSRCVELGVEYAKTREQFGVTIAHFQALRHQLADTALLIEPARGLEWYAAYSYDHVPEDSERFAALAKAHLTERAVDVGRRTVEAHGGIGYTWESDVHFFLKRAIFDRGYFGSPKVHRARVADLNDWAVTA
jgi:alkylation response protein AidB-like acyl-CoA dehydrogenase